MAFADWKKRNTVMAKCIPDGYQAMAYVVAQAAYKAGERDGAKRTEEICKQAILLRNALGKAST